MAAESQDKDRPKPLLCMRKVTRENGNKRTCMKIGYAVWVGGEFGRSAHVLCGPCINELRRIGWKVRYQIEGDNPIDLVTP